MAVKFEKPLHSANIAASIAVVATTFADLTLAGGAATLIGGALSVSALVKRVEGGQKDTALQIATSLRVHLHSNRMNEDRKRILAQTLAAYLPSDQDLAAGSMNAKNIAALMRERIKAQATDPEHKTTVALTDYERTLAAMLNLVLEPASQSEAMLQELLARTEEPREAQRLRNAGITEVTIIQLALRIASDTTELNQAWHTLQNAVGTAIKQKQHLEPKVTDYRRQQFNELVAELSRQSNLPYEVQKARAEARVAVDAKAYGEARKKLTEAAAMTRNTAEQANLDYARSLAALGALAFTEEDFGEARLQYFKAMNLMGLEEDRQSHYRNSYVIASSAWIARNLNYEEGRRVLDEMVKADVSPNEVTYNTLINLAPSYDEGRRVLDEMVKADVSPNEVTYNTLINLAPSYEEGRRILDEMVKADVSPNEVTYNTLINLAPSYEEGRRILDEMVKADVSPNEVTYNTLINLAPSYDEGRRVLDEMVKADVSPDEVTYNTLINLAPSYEEGRRVLDEMVKADVSPDEVTYNTLINLAPSYEEGRRVLDEMVKADVSPNEVTYNTLINLAPSYDEGRRVLDEMVKADVSPNEVTYNTLINLAPSYEEGRRVLDEMVKADVSPNEVTYSTLINLAPSYEEGRRVLDEMVKADVSPNEVTYSTLINLAPSYEEGRRVLDEMVKADVSPNEVTYSTLINLALSYEEGRRVLDEMVKADVSPDEVTYSTLINLAPSYEEGRRVLDEMVKADVSPNEVTYSTLINLAPSYEEGRRVLDEMVKADVSPNEVTLTTLLKIGATFNEGCELAVFARDTLRAWFTGRGFYSALFARPIDHISAGDLLAKYFELPFSFDTSLENPIRQYRRTRQQEQALGICVRFPYLPAAAKFFRERAEYCLPALSEMIARGEESEDVHYAAGIASQINQHWDQAEKRLKMAHEIATEPARTDDIRARLDIITDNLS